MTEFELVVAGVALFGVPFVLSTVTLVLNLVGRSRLRQLERTIARQQTTIDELKNRLQSLREEAKAAAMTTSPVSATAAPPMPPAVPSTAADVAAAPASPAAAAPHAPVPHPAPPIAPREPAPATVPPRPISAPTPASTATSPRHTTPSASTPPTPPPPHAAQAWPFPWTSFDWESVVGVKLFSAIAGIALVLAAIFFLRYSMDHGWLAPSVRVAIGVLVAAALLVVCELRAARKYPATANALDAAAIAILFSTFFAAHALWHLMPATLTFGLLGLVTVLAVLLSVRRDSLFIAVLGLLGGFATPALLSTGENRPIPLFAYLLLLNLGLAWVASRKRWVVLTVLTLALTALYQWGWVNQFLSASQLSLAMGIFLLFAVVSFVAVTFGRTGNESTDTRLGQLGLFSSAMPLMFAVFLATVPAYGAHAGLLFGFLLIVDVGLAAVAIVRPRFDSDTGYLVAIDAEWLHALGAGAAVLVLAIWLTQSYATGSWIIATGAVAALVALYSLAPMMATRMGHGFGPVAQRAEFAAPALLLLFPVLARIEPAVATPALLFSVLFGLLALIAWRALTTGTSPLYFIAAFFTVAAEATWSATFLTTVRLGSAIALYAVFGLFHLGVPLAARRVGQALTPPWGTGALTIVSLGLLLFLASGDMAPASLWGLAFLLAVLNAGLFVESASGGLPWLSAAGAILSWIVLAVWWGNAAAAVGLLPSLLMLVGLALVMFTGHAWAYRQIRKPVARGADALKAGRFQQGIYLGLVGHLFLFYIGQVARWSLPPWPLFGALLVMTMGASAASMIIEAGQLHAAAVIAAAVVLYAWTTTAMTGLWAMTAVVTVEAAAAYGLVWIAMAGRSRIGPRAAAIGATGALFAGELALVSISTSSGSPGVAVLTVAHVVNVALILWVAWQQAWPFVAPAAVIPAWLAAAAWQSGHPEPRAWTSLMGLATSLYAVFAGYPFVLHRRARDSRDPYLTAVVGSAFFLFVARSALIQGGLTGVVGLVPVVEAGILALLLRELLGIQPSGERDLGRLAFVAGAALGFVTVAIPLQLKNQWVTIGWALEGAALAWLYRQIPHRKLLYAATALLATVFARLALNPSIFVYEPRGMRVFNWYLYTYVLCGVAMLVAGWLLARTDDRIFTGVPPARSFLPAAGVILLFLVLNIEIADFYATGPEIMFKFGVTIAQDLTYTIGWLAFGLALLTAGIYLHNRPARIAAVVLITITTCKAFLYDMGSLGGLYRVASLVGLAISLSLVALALQKFVLHVPKEETA